MNYFREYFVRIKCDNCLTKLTLGVIIQYGLNTHENYLKKIKGFNYECRKFDEFRASDR